MARDIDTLREIVREDLDACKANGYWEEKETWSDELIAEDMMDKSGADYTEEERPDLIICIHEYRKVK